MQGRQHWTIEDKFDALKLKTNDVQVIELQYWESILQKQKTEEISLYRS